MTGNEKGERRKIESRSKEVSQGSAREMRAERVGDTDAEIDKTDSGRTKWQSERSKRREEHGAKSVSLGKALCSHSHLGTNMGLVELIPSVIHPFGGPKWHMNQVLGVVLGLGYSG